MSKKERKSMSPQELAAAGLSGVNQQRKGTYVPRKSSIIESLNKALRGSFTELTEASETNMRDNQPWLENLQRKNIFTVRKGKILFEIPLTESFNGIYSARYSPDGEIIATSFGAGAIQTWKAETGELMCTVRGGMEHAYPVMCIRFHHQLQDTFFGAGTCGNIYLCKNKPGQYKKVIEEKNNEINSIDINHTSSILISGGKDAVLRVYDLESQQLVSMLPPPNSIIDQDKPLFHSLRIFAIKFHPLQPDIFLTGGWDEMVKIWDIRVKDGCVRNIKGPHICGDAIDIRDQEVLTGAWTSKDSIQLWDMGSGELIDTILPTNRPVSEDGEFLYCVQYFHGDSSGDTIVAGGSGTKVVEVISISDKKILTFFKRRKPVQAIDSYDTNIVYGGMESTLKIAEFVRDQDGLTRKAHTENGHPINQYTS